MTKPVGNAAASPSRAAFLPRRTAAGSGRRFGRGARVPAAVLAAVFAAGLPAAGQEETRPTVSIDSPSVAEGDGGSTTLTYGVTLSATSTGIVMVGWSDSGNGSATSGTDYAAVDGATLTFQPGESRKTIAVSVTGDGVDEPDETILMTLGEASGATIGTGTGTGTITDDDAAPTVTLSLADDSISENGGSTTVSATLSHPSSEATTITIEAAAGAYTVGADGTITIAAGDTANASDTATINAVDNDTGEADRSVSVTGSAGNAQGIGQVTGASLTLEDDDGGAGPTGPSDAEPTVSINSPSVAEGAAGTTATLTFTVSLDAASDGEVTVDYAEGMGGTAASGTDYTALASGTLTFAAGDTSRSIAVSVTGDATDEPDETVVVTLGNASGATVGSGTGTGTITDDDAAPTVTLAVADDSISENGGSTTVSATLSHASSEATTITISAVADAYTVGSDGTITIAAGDTANASDTATINAVDNDTGEADRSVSVTGSASNTQGIGEVTGASLTLEDDDGGAGPGGPSESEPTVSINSPSVSEGAAGTTATLTFTVSLDAASDGEVTVDYAEGTGGTAASGTDYTALALGTLTFAVGDTSKSIAVSVTGDATDEPDETVVVALGNASGATVGSGTGTGTITDDDAAPTVTLALADASISENGGTTTVSATLSHPSSAATIITITPVANAYEVGSLAVGLDATITIAAGSTANPSDTAAITAVDNAADEANRSVTVTGSASNTQGIGRVTGASLTLVDDDGEPSLAINAPSVTEGDSGSASLNFTVTLSPASAGEVTVDYAEGTGGTAVSGTDYTAPASGTLTFAAGDTSKTITVSVTGDSTDEPDETVVVTLGNASGAVVGSGTGTGTITDDDAAPTVTLALADDSISENGGSTTVSATLSHPSSEATTITISPVANAYTVGADATITIAAGDTANASDTATINAVAGDTGEADRSVSVTGSASNTQGIGRVTGASLTLEDDDGGSGPTGPSDGEPTMSINSPSVAEGAAGTTATLTFTVSLSAASTQAVTVDYAEATGGTATAGTDYTAPASGTLTIAAGDTGATIAVTVTGDGVDEPDETILMTLGEPAGATLGTGTGTGTITDDDAAPTVTLAVADDSISENGGSTTVSATLSHPSSAATTITISPVADAYTVGADATITIAAGDTANASDTAMINAVDNDTGEANRSVSVTGSATNTQGIGRVTGASLTLEDDDGGAGPTGSQTLPTISINTPSVTEGNSGTATLTFTLTLSAASAEGKETVRYRDAGTGTATAGTDYVALATTDTTFDGVDYAAASFAAGNTTATINVTVNGDTLDEEWESIDLILSNPESATLASTSARGTIIDDDASPSLSISSPSVTEGDSGSTNLRFQVTLSTASGRGVTVNASQGTGGTATSGTDYTAISATDLSFSAGTTTKNFDVSVTGDTLDEPDETVVVTLSGAMNATLSSTAASGTGTITDDDDPPTVSVAAVSVTEGDSGSKNLTFTATLSPASGKQVTVAWAEGTGGTATSGTDYTAITGGTLTFAAGTTSQTFHVSVTGDVVDESDETVVVTLSSPTNATLSSTAASATGTITDDDGTPTKITLTVNDDSVGEGDGDTTITVTATVVGATRFGVDKTVTVSVAGSGTASAVDFAAVSDFDITIAAGAASKSETFTLSPTDDSVDETDETITVSGTSTGLTVNQDTITLSDDDAAPTSITLTVDDSSVAEDDGGTTITVTATVDGTTRFVDDTTVEVSVAGSGTAAAVDFAAVSNFNISIGAGEASGTETFTLTPTDDAVHEANETITVSGTSGALTVNSATITLTDDEALPTVALSLSPTSVGEAGGASTVTATLSAESSAAVTLTVGAAAGTGAVAADFALSTAKTLTIAAGATTSTGTVTVTAADNDVDAANKSVTVSATVTGGNGVAAPSDVTLTLTDDDTAGVTFNPTTLTVTEQGASQSFTVVLDSEPTGGVNGTTWVGLTPSGGGLDLNTALTYPYNLSFDTSNWDTPQTVAVTALGDSDRANDSKQIRYTVAGYTGGEVTNQLAVTVTVIDDDKPNVSLSLSSSSISENGGVATVTATLDEAVTVATTVTVAAAAGTDTDASDFTLSSANTLTIAARNTTSTGTVTITAVNNALDEPDKSVTVSGTVSHNGVTEPAAKTLTITDDDPAPMLSIDSPSVTEGDSGSTDLTFTATLSAASGREVTVDYADAGTGTATSGTDYTAITGGTLTFEAGTTSQTFDVSVTGDVLDEANETVKVRLKDPVNAAVSTTAGTGTGTITDDDATPTLLISSPSVAEGDSGSTSLTYTVTLSAASGREVTVQYADSRLGTATSGTDYTAITAGTLTFAAGTTSRTFSVSVTGDTVAESDETVEVTWSNAANATITTRAGLVTNALRVDGTITDDDGAPDTITLTVDDADVGEGDGATTITVTATVDGTTRFGVDKTVRVSVSASGTTGNVVDFATVPAFDIGIAAGAASGTATFTLTPTDDTEDETDETITVSGTSTGLTVNPDTISLTDDDGTTTSITLTVDDTSVGEGDGATTITVTATLNGTGRFIDPKTVQVSVAGSGTAGAVDFAAVTAFDITIAARAASGAATFTLTPTDDVVDETDETITVRGTSSGLTVNSATISLTDNDAAPTAITLTVSDSSVGEGDGATSITVTATVDGTTRFAEAKTVRVSVAGSGAAGAVDFAAVEAFDIEIAAGAASDTAGFTLTPTDDAVDETNETITVRGTSSGLTVNAATISLTDDDGAPTSITLTVDDSSVGEGDGAATITVTATVDSTMRFAEDTTVAVSVAGSGTATAVDFAAVSSFDITIPAGAASRTGSFTLTPTDDAVDETDETVTVSGTSGSLTVNSATITLTDNDAAPTSITLTVSDDSVSEGDGATAITVTATVDGTTRFAAATTVSVLVRSDSGTMNAVDFASVPAFDITIAAGAASGTETFTLTPTNDAVDENNETITVYGASGSLTVSSATITLTDDDATPTAITLTVSPNSVAEDDGATAITVTATVDGTTRFATAKTVSVSVAGSGTATAVDFAAVSDFDIEIPAADASASETFTLTPTNDAFDETNETITVSGTSGSLTVNSATISLTDDDDAPTQITLTVDDNSVAEDDGATTITVTATVDGSSRFVDATTVTVSVAGSGTATAVDFAAVSDFDIEIPAADASASETFTLTPTNDVVDETNETITVSGVSGSLTVGSATITLTDDDATPSITLTVDDNSVAEDDGATTITVTATVDGTTRFAAATTVTVSVGSSGTATAVDFAAVSDFDITIAAEAQSKTGTFTLTPTNDAVDETNETVTVSGTSTGLTVNSATITLTDDDAAPTAITLTVNDNSVAEDDGATTITVTATVDGTTRFVAATTVTVSVGGSGTATAVDFATVSDFDITIAAGDASKTGTFTLTPTNDAVDETDETITVSGASGSLTVNSATISLTDDDAMPTLSISSPSVSEGDSGSTDLTFTVTLSAASGRQVTVAYADAGTGTATSGTDYTAITGGTLNFAVGTTSQTFAVSVTGDVLDESNETVLVSLSSPTNAVVSNTAGTGTGTITDDDAAPTSITLTVDDNSVGEGDGATTITVKATVDGTTRFATAKTVTVSVAGSGTDTAVDFAAVSSFDIEIAAGAQSEDETFTLTPTNDVVDETDETVTVRGTSSGLTVNSATISLTDDDAAPTAITLTVNPNSVAEDDGATTITVTATVDGTTRFAEATTVTVSVGGSGTATAVDFAAVNAFDIEIAAEAQSKTGTFTLTPTNDVVDETDETVTVSGSSGSLTVNSATITLTDDDDAPTAITLTVDDNSVGEGDGATTITVTATVDGATRFAAATTVTVSVGGSGTATAVDFAAVTAFDITIAAEEASKTGTFTLTPTDDVVDETDETVTVGGESGGLTVNSATITITDDDDAPTAITLTVNDDSVAEDDGATTITVTATVDGTTRFAAATTVEVSVAGSGTATAVDFASVSNFNIEIAAEEASKTGTFTLTPTNDVVDETDETITVGGTSGSLTVNSATITLTDDDDAPTAITLTVDDNSVAEDDGATTITVTATVDGATRFAEATTVTVSVGGSGTATAVDFAAVSSFDIEIAAGAQSESETFMLTPTDDVVDETNETITVSGSSGTLTVNSATITLTDDDAAPTAVTLTVNDNSVGEGDGATTIIVTATVDGATRFAAATTVTVSVGGSGTASAVDFAAVSDFDIEIAAEAASKTGTFTLTPTDDTADETDETVTVSGTSGSLTVNSATITLTDDDGPPSLSLDSPRVTEGDSGTTNLTFKVLLSPASGQQVTVNYADAGTGTATSGTDYTALPPGTLNFAAGTISQTFNVSVTGDVVEESNETVVVTLSSATNATISATAGSGTGTIVDDDAPPPSDPPEGPSFEFEVSDPTWQVGRAIEPLRLPQLARGGARLTYSLTPELPAGLTLDLAARTITGTPTGAPSAREYRWTATDPGGRTTTHTFRITVLGEDPAFEFEVPDRTWREGSAIEPLRLPQLVGGSAGVSYSLTPEPPAGLVLDLAGRTITGTPTTPQSAREYRWAATDPGGDAVTDTFRITVLEDHQPSFEAVVGPGQLFGEFRFPVGREITPEELPSAEGGDGLLTYAVTPALPPGLTFSPGSRTLSGAPTEARERAIHVLTATDEDGDTASLSFAVTTIAIPMVMEIRIVSRPAAEGTYRYGEQIELEAEFSAPVTVAGSASLGLTVGERVRRASLFGGSGAVLRFRYTVGATDRDGDGVSVAANALALGGAESAEVDLSHAPLPDQPGHRVDGSPQAVGTLPALTLTLGGEPARVAVEDAFHAAFRYAARSSAPEVAAVSLEDATVVVSAVADGVATVTVTGTNAGGSAEQRFEVTVMTARAEMEVVEHALAGLGRSLLTSASATVGRRLMAGGGGGRRSEEGGPEGGETETVTFSGLPTDDRLRLEEALRTSRNFTLSATQGGRRWTIWGAGDLQSFEGEAGPGSSYSGQPLNSWLGVDVSAGRLLAGVAVSRSTGEMEYAFQDPGTSVSGDGRLETRLMQAHPYLRWTAGQTRVWGQGGVGRGTAKLSRSVTGATEEGSLRLLVGLAGVRRELGTAGGTALALRADLGGARLQAEGGTGVLDDLSATVYRSRLGLELSRQVGMATPFFEFGGRYDGGSGATGAGLELAGGVRVADARSRIGVEAQGRVLALHSAAGYRESGVSLTARFTPSGGERGLGLEVQPVWGAPAHGAQALWADHELGALRPESGGGAMVARMRYGFGLLSPFTEVTWSEALSRMLRAGVRVGRFGEAVEIELAGSRQATEGGGPSYRFDLYGRIRIP